MRREELGSEKMKVNGLCPNSTSNFLGEIHWVY